MITDFSIWLLIKILVLIFLAIYIIFSLVVIRQVQLMTKTLEVGFETQLRLLSFAHFLCAIGVFIFAIAIL